MKKAVIITLVASVLLLGGGTAYAQTTSTQSVEQLIAQLKAQIAELSKQLEQLKAAQAGIASTQQSVSGTLKLIGDLREGMSGDQVILLQSALALDPEVYPEGVITGYYGSLTAKALKRFEEKHRIRGNASSTRARLNEILAANKLRRGDDDDWKKNGVRFCLDIPPGHLIAPGWLKKNHSNRGHGKWNDDLILPRCKFPTATTTPPTTPDTTAPLLSAIAVGNVSATAGTISFSTNELTTARIFLSTTSPVSTTSTPFWTNATFALTHNASLAGLTANTPYFFVIEATDKAGNKGTSAQGGFTTSIAPDVTAPVISLLSGVPTGSTTATVSWTTNEAATSVVYYSTTSPIDIGIASSTSNAAFVTSHVMPLSGLMASTTYHTLVLSRDAANNSATSSPISFMTSQ